VHKTLKEVPKNFHRKIFIGKFTHPTGRITSKNFWNFYKTHPNLVEYPNKKKGIWHFIRRLL